jgi:RNA polymerase sigma-70 factor, ECF subfamily
LNLRARDLYLVCALGLGDRLAQTIFETEYMPRVRHALLQFGTSEPGIADIKQNLYGRLLEKQDVTVVRSGYGGRGDLGSWLCTCAIREAGHRARRGQRELALEQASEEILRDLRNSPESATLTGRLKEVFQQSFKEAIATLSSRERNLLRYHFLAELTIDQIGTLYHVHRATAARWVARAQENLVKKTRELFVVRAQVNTESLPRIMELIESQLSVNHGNVLKGAPESDPRSGGSAQ